MNTKTQEESKRLKILGPQEEWNLILSAIHQAEKNMKPEHRKPQLQRAIEARSPLASNYFVIR
jgi:hypothetical protein